MTRFSQLGRTDAALAQIYATRTWTENGLLASVMDANENLSALEYDGFDRLRRLYFPDDELGAGEANEADYEQYGYDANGNRIALRLRSGQTIEYAYDALNREVFKDIPDGTSADVYSAYDLAGRRMYARFVSHSGDGIAYAYDTVGRLASETSYGRTLAFLYDAASNRTRITFPDSEYVEYTYDALNRVDQVKLNGSASGLSLVADYAYDPMSRRVSLERGNGVDTTYGYTDASRLASLAHDVAGSANDATWAFQYTDAGQLESRSWIQAYEWPVAALDEEYERNGLNQYTEVDSAAFNYDSRGNLVSDGARNFEYDLENRLISASGSVEGELSYDPLGRLRSFEADDVTTEFLYDGDRLVAEYVDDEIMRRYVHGAGVDEPLVWYEGDDLADPRWLIADRQGSIIATTDASGAATIYRYGPYGEPESWSGPRFRYTGQAALPELQLYHYKARVYDPLLGRFLQTDPVEYEDDLNLYAYVRNDPLNLSDPQGMQTWESITGWIAGDAATPDPTDLVPVKWIGYGGAIILGAVVDHILSEATPREPDIEQETADHGLMRPPPSLVDDRGRGHILEGDATGGGHRAGTGRPGRSEFPADWSDDRILGEISDVATDPESDRRTEGSRTVSEGTRGGVDVRTVDDGTRIVTGYPTNRPRNADE